MIPNQAPAADQTIVEHLGELRTRLLLSVYGLIPAFALCWWQIDNIFEYISRPIKPFLPDHKFIIVAPMDMFVAYLQVALVVGVVLTCPWWLYQVWCFVAPGLYRKEKKFATLFLLFGTLLFITGIGFAYFLVFPMAFKFLLTFGAENATPTITVDNYLSFFVSTTLVFGVCFELPLILAILGMLGIIDRPFLVKNRRYAVVVLATVSAVVTPPDLLSMMSLLIPLMFLYELGAIVVGILAPKPGTDITQA
ncbi:MAG: twin-arginine translocase subunit TatC [Bdellovibrionia bacterium]